VGGDESVWQSGRVGPISDDCVVEKKRWLKVFKGAWGEEKRRQKMFWWPRESG
jgi:hypothetical protein